ncbi:MULTISPECIES: DUF4238 domain-containing protein [unclassified Rhizobium]|uniref:DUF4238 domain-containing protein n=1 Tax=unclassified Rhizobium TaxID=2613769 RepID=UPI001C83234D|nr:MULTISPECIES: DUF4238 domain-containing protein [unclassified Rhizobium]MBX5163115.1 DUF4238 domain-containing protein [Rhizobium sp. NZLR4b]MBX5183966.1 DUF4238 domain-containing protein [Rhizobium sp. NZLR5]MBX5207534.1 DUF4238 domain-containing protein [Rhizobium sp. NZLR11]
MAKDHYIPQSLLRRFVEHDKGRNLNVLDKLSGEMLHPAVKDFGSIKDFHTLSLNMRREFPDEDLPQIEDLLNSEFEDLAAPLFARVVESSSLSGLTPDDRQVIIRFVALQWVRTPGRIFNMRSGLARMSGKEEPARNLKVFGTPTTPDPLRDVGLLGIPIDAEGLANVLRRAHLALALAPGELAVVGDNPVIALYDRELPENVYAAFLVSARGSDVFLPISPRHILYLHTDQDATTGTCGKTLPTPLELSVDAMSYLNGLQGKNAVQYLVVPRQDQIAKVKADIATQQAVRFNFKRAFD